jgi:asparagine synthase (glutamine-hydrolysing)
MAHSIEVRSPLLDYRVVEWAARLPRTTLFNSKHGKMPLRDLSRKLLPAEVQQGAKRGFEAPIGDWFRHPEGQKFARERLLSAEARQRGLWNIKGAETLLNAHQANSKRSFGGWLWRLLMLDAWARHYMDNKAFLQNPPNQKS